MTPDSHGPNDRPSLNSNRSSFDFDEVIDRRNSDSSKWGALAAQFNNPDAIPMWVADMDFKSPQPIIDALVERAQHGVFGYGMSQEDDFDCVTDWLRTRHQWEVDRASIVFSPGVLSGLAFFIKEHSNEGDGVLIQPPVYYPFARIIKDLNRNVVENELVLGEDGKYHIDFDDLAAKADSAKIMILCSPHNPVGRVWNEDELRQTAAICEQKGVFVVADEIHADLALPGHRHLPLLKAAPSLAKQAAILMAPSKTFNIAGLHSAFAVIPDKAVRTTFQHDLRGFGVSSPDLFAKTAMLTAYRKGAPWLDGLLSYLAENVETAVAFLRDNVPGVTAIQPEGTYLLWVDCRGLGLSDADLKKFMNETVGVAANQGEMFGSGGSSFIRLNIGCPRSQMMEALIRLQNAVKQRA